MKNKSPFKALHGKRVLIPYPIVEADPSKKVLLLDKDQESLSKEQEEKLIDKYLRIKVLQVGAECERIKEGDEIFIPARALMPGRSDAIEIDDTKFFIINETDIAATY